MKELKEYLGYNPHVQTVYFDAHGNWFIHKGRTVVSEKSREEILGEGNEEDAEPVVKEGKKKK